MILRHPIPIVLVPFFLLALPSFSFNCELDTSSILYDLKPLDGIRYASKNTPTPPTNSEAKVSMRLCGELEKDDGVPDEDQCPPHTKLCLRLLNYKESASEKERVTAVVPIWTTDTPDDSVWIHPQGRNGQDGVKISVQGPDYAGTPQHLNLSLVCDRSASSPDPKFIEYSSGHLTLEWATPDACPQSDFGLGGGGEGGVGLWSLIKFIFWFIVIGLIIYFAVGIFYNHQQYSAKGWDLIPHRDFWRSTPDILRDLFGHLFANVRGGGGGSRGGYSSLG